MSVLSDLRSKYHDRLCNDLLRRRTDRNGAYLNIADKDSKNSRDLANGIGDRLGRIMLGPPLPGQTVGQRFAQYTRDFVDESLGHLTHVRPGDFETSTSQNRTGIGNYAQYRHLVELKRLTDANADLKTALGTDYLITPDIVVSRAPISDADLNAHGILVEPAGSEARRTPLREGNMTGSPRILIASVSCKWTTRSDRAQNTRTEALNLIRNRKGHTPHIAVVLFEPLPTRIAAIAIGTGDVDCTYHAALYELLAAADDLARNNNNDALQEFLLDMVNGGRLRDISDLPLDIAS